MRTASPFAIAFALAFTLSGSASAQGYDDALATELFNAGRDLLAAGRTREACPKLEESARLAPKVGTFGKLAECEHQLGHLALARSNWQRAQNLARVENDERLPIIDEQLARVDALVPKLRLALPVDRPADLAIRINEMSLGASGAEVPIPLDPGRYEVRVSAAGKEPWTTSVTLAADGAVTQVAVPPLAALAAPAPPAAPVAPVTAPGSGISTFQAAGALAAGLGLVGLAVGGAYGVVAKSKLDDSNLRGCVENTCTAEGAAIRNDARGAGDAATAFFVVGSALVASGVTLFVLAPRDDAPRMQASVAAGPAGAAATLTGAF